VLGEYGLSPSKNINDPGAKLNYYVNRNALPWEPLAAKARDEIVHECLVELDKKPLNNEGLQLE